MRVVVAKPPLSAARSSFTSSSVRSNRGRRERKTFFYGLAAAPSFDDDDDYNGGFGLKRIVVVVIIIVLFVLDVAFAASPSTSRDAFRRVEISLRENRGRGDENARRHGRRTELREWYGEDSSVGKDLGEAMKKKKREKKEENEEEEAVRNDEEENGAYQASVNGVASTSESSPKKSHIRAFDSGSSSRSPLLRNCARRLDVKVACENVEAESARYGPYVDVADLGNAEALRRSLAGVRSVIVPAGKFDDR